MSSYGLTSIKGYFDEKQITGNEILQFCIMMILSILLIIGGVFILQGEDIFKKIYEGYVTMSSVPTGGSCNSGSSVYTTSWVSPHPSFPVGATLSTTDSQVCIANCPPTQTLVYSDETPISSTTIDLSKLYELSGGVAGMSPSAFITTINNMSNYITCIGSGGSGDGGSGINKIKTTSNIQRWTATLPEDLTLGQLQKNVSFIRKKSQINIYTGYTMIATGSIISLYQIYNLFF